MEYNKEYEYYTQRNGHRRGGDPNCDTAEQDSEQCRYTCAKAGVLLIVGSGNFSYSEEIEKQEIKEKAFVYRAYKRFFRKYEKYRNNYERKRRHKRVDDIEYARKRNFSYREGEIIEY